MPLLDVIEDPFNLSCGEVFECLDVVSIGDLKLLAACKGGENALLFGVCDGLPSWSVDIEVPTT